MDSNVTTAPTLFTLHKRQITIATGITTGIATVEWNASPVNDILADSIIALLMHAQSSAASIRITSKPCNHNNNRRPRDDGDDKIGSGDGDEPLDDDGVIGTMDEGKKHGIEKARKKRQKGISSVLRMIHDTLLHQFDSDQFEAAYEATRATFEIKTDAGLESGSLGEGEELVCHVTVEFDAEDDSNENAKITVECSDAKFGANIQDCLRGIAQASGPVSLFQ